MTASGIVPGLAVAPVVTRVVVLMGVLVPGPTPIPDDLEHYPWLCPFGFQCEYLASFSIIQYSFYILSAHKKTKKKKIIKYIKYEKNIQMNSF